MDTRTGVALLIWLEQHNFDLESRISIVDNFVNGHSEFFSPEIRSLIREFFIQYFNGGFRPFS